MRRLVPVLVLAICFAATPALAGKYNDDEGRPYLTLSGGGSKIFSADFYDTATSTNHDIVTDYGFNGMVAAGLAYKAGRVELSGGYNYMKFDEEKINGAPATALNGSINAMSLLISAFFEGNSDGAISPYIGGGVGAARVAIDSGMLAAKKGTGFAYQVGGGINLNMGDSFSVDLGYRLLGVTNVSLGNFDADSVLFHNANVGLRFIF